MPPIRPLLPADLPQAHALTRQISWPHRLEDWQFALAMGEGVAIAEADRLLGTAISWRLGHGWGCFGMLIVAPDQQGRGLGAQLMEAALARLEHRAVQLHATTAGENLYRRLGFAAHGTIRQHQGVARAPAAPPASPGTTLRPATPADLPALAALDTAATAMDRSRVLAALLPAAQAVVLDRAGTPAGFAILRPFGRGLVIGPVVATSTADAQTLIAHLIAQHTGEFLRIDSTDVTLSPWLESTGLACVDEALRMVRGTPPTPGTLRSFALVNQALG